MLAEQAAERVLGAAGDRSERAHLSAEQTIQLRAKARRQATLEKCQHGLHRLGRLVLGDAGPVRDLLDQLVHDQMSFHGDAAFLCRAFNRHH